MIRQQLAVALRTWASKLTVCNTRLGGAYGGKGGINYFSMVPALPYGSASAPTDPGSGSGGASGGFAGGGAIRIDASGAVTDVGMTEAELIRLIRDAGRTLVLRDAVYNELQVY